MPKSRKYSSKFNLEWLQIEKYKKWLQKADSNENKAMCKICNVQFDISNMGLPAIESHDKGAKHKRLMVQDNPKNSVLNFFNKKSAITEVIYQCHVS